MGLFDVAEEKLKALYHRAWLESGQGGMLTHVIIHI